MTDDEIMEDWINSIENYKDEPIVGQWQDYIEEV